jgi:hypothetical protein
MSKRRRGKSRRGKATAKQPFELQAEENSLPKTFRKRLYTLLYKEQHGAICKSILEILHYFQQHNFRAFNVEALSRISDLVSAIFTVVSDPAFTIPKEYVPLMISRAHLFANLVALSDYRTTDNILQQVLRQENNLYKILFLYGVKNTVRIDGKMFFDRDPSLASLWYFTYPLAPVGCLLPHYQANMRDHFENIDHRFTPFDFRVTTPYFYCTYFAGEGRHDRKVKELINVGCRRNLAGVEAKIKNKPARDSIAIVTSKWSSHTAVYKSCFPFLDRFRSRYRMTLVHTGPYSVPSLARDYFDEVHEVRFVKTGRGTHELTTDPIMENDFQLMYYADIGMTDESIWLSNLRLAPIQVTSYGHPVSTFGSEIDYFVVGEETEVLDDLDKNYSETPIVLPGLGCVPVWPGYKRKYPEKKTEKVVANCVWGPDKYNYTMIRMLQEIFRLTNRVEYAIFASRGVNRYNAFLTFAAELNQHVGKFATLHSDKEYMDYMEEAECGDFTINSWPFGGYNTVVESLYLGKPVVTLEGDRFYNLAASALLRRVGLENLIARTAPEFIELCAKMASDPVYLAEQKARLAEVDLRKALFDTDEPLYFEKMMEYIIDNHGQLDKKPLIARELVCL